MSELFSNVNIHNEAAREKNLPELENSPVFYVKYVLGVLASRGRGGQESVLVIRDAIVNGKVVQQGGRFDDLYVSGFIDKNGVVTSPYVRALVPLAVDEHGVFKQDYQGKAAQFMKENDRLLSAS